MRSSKSDDAALRRKRAIHLRIGRSRRRVDARLSEIRSGGESPLSWRTYIVRYPAWSMAAALAAGFAASVGANFGSKSAQISRWLESRLVRGAIGELGRCFWRELRRSGRRHE